MSELLRDGDETPKAENRQSSQEVGQEHKSSGKEPDKEPYIDGMASGHFWLGEWGDIPLPQLNRLLSDYGTKDWSSPYTTDGRTLDQFAKEVYQKDRQWFERTLHIWSEQRQDIANIASELGLTSM